ncbi:MAG: hypothetical protein US24_C0033G0003 [candidate division WS6 bacterium GW2011_GWC2_36_7]|uniref:Baseplate protein J-like domain-containing protein n=1 Tax=candidate division WS6 bacterium GW2011_GWC2_36_7 TaxID=1619091 RepID=A0A0G0EWI0_9BACT|nr:MAG: hypothetical protein US24_C0033G0003 [candidate division WS6 bacterium GW2011_GWC2_36_7]
MEENEKITKIVVGREDELTDVVSGILNAKTDRIILTFAEESDILISSINLSVIKETAEEEGKVLVCQIIKNPTGQRNSKIAGITTIDTPNNPTEDVWEKAQTPEPVAKSPVVEKSEAKLEEKSTTSESSNSKSSSFETRINEAIQKSRTDIEKKKDVKTIHQDGIIISVGEDLPSEENDTSEVKPNLSNLDFKDVLKTEQSHKDRKPLFSFLQFLSPKTKSSPSNTISTQAPLTRKFKKLLPILLISVVFITALVLVVYLNTVPFVKVRVFVKAQEVSIERTFTGDANIKEIDFEALKIPIKTESVEEARSTSITATGRAFKGEKSAGAVTLTHPNPSGTCTALSLPAGQVVISADGKTYSLDSAISLECDSFLTTPVHATDIGEEYNTPSSYFTVQNYSSTEVFGYRSGTFTGGSKTEYTVLSLSDVNTASDELKTSSISEAEKALQEKQGEWALITDSVKSEIKKDSLKTDVAIGAEATQANLSLTVTSSGTYYYSNGFDAGVATLLTTEAQTKNLFQTDQNLDLTLGEDIQKDVSVVQKTDNSVLIKLIASGSVQPKIDKTEIVNTLKGKKWKEGTTYLDGLKYSDKATMYEFNPVNFPQSLYYFPKRQGGILVEIVDI